MDQTVKQERTVFKGTATEAHWIKELKTLPEGVRQDEDGEPFLINVSQNLELARGAGVRGEVDEGIDLLRSTLRKVERFFGTPVNVVYRDTLSQLVGLLRQKTQYDTGADASEKELAKASERLRELQQQLS